MKTILFWIKLNEL